jgi:hypothetical protein
MTTLLLKSEARLSRKKKRMSNLLAPNIANGGRHTNLSPCYDDRLSFRACRPSEEESSSLRIDRRALLDHFDGTVVKLRLSVAASQQTRIESQSRRIREVDAKKMSRSELSCSCDASASLDPVRDPVQSESTSPSPVALHSGADRTSDAAVHKRQDAELEEALIWRARRLHRKNRRKTRPVTP